MQQTQIIYYKVITSYTELIQSSACCLQASPTLGLSCKDIARPLSNKAVRYTILSSVGKYSTLSSLCSSLCHEWSRCFDSKDPNISRPNSAKNLVESVFVLIPISRKHLAISSSDFLSAILSINLATFFLSSGVSTFTCP